MDLEQMLTTYGEIGVVVGSLFWGFWFFLRKYEASNREVIRRSEEIVIDVKTERDLWRETAMTNFELVAAEQEKTRRLTEAFAERTDDLDAILHFLRSFQAATPGDSTKVVVRNV